MASGFLERLYPGPAARVGAPPLPVKAEHNIIISVPAVIPGGLVLAAFGNNGAILLLGSAALLE